MIAPEKPWLAPLAGWSDLPFRLLCREEGAFVTCTEMVSSKGLVYGGKNTEDLLATETADTPLVVQVFGAEKDFMEKGVSLLQERGFSYFDINMGCSVTKVVKTGAGAAMLKNVDNLLQVAEVVIKQAHKYNGNNEGAEICEEKNITHTKKIYNPHKKTGKIGFKMRLGYEMGKEVYKDVACELERLGADWITLHPRFAKQAFSGVPHYESLRHLKSEVKIPIIASGDLFTAIDGVRVLLETGVDGLMYARGAMANPFIFKQHTALLNEVKMGNIKMDTHFAKNAQDFLRRSEEEMRHDLKDLICRHLAYAKKYNPRRALLQMRTIVPRYVKHLENAKTLRLALIACKSFEELESILENI